MRSAEYGAYLLLGGKPISRSLFFEMKCWCIVNADHEKCACPLCTQMFELVKDWHRQRSSWYRDADRRRAADPEAAGECSCGSCAPDSAYRSASKSVQALNDFLLLSMSQGDVSIVADSVWAACLCRGEVAPPAVLPGPFTLRSCRPSSGYSLPGLQ